VWLIYIYVIIPEQASSFKENIALPTFSFVESVHSGPSVIEIETENSPGEETLT
jgi:hypothetical protein